MLPGRTDNAIKNRFHATERARLRGKLDETLLADPIYNKRIIDEAARLNADCASVTTRETDDATIQMAIPVIGGGAATSTTAVWSPIALRHSGGVSSPGIIFLL